MKIKTTTLSRISLFLLLAVLTHGCKKTNTGGEKNVQDLKPFLKDFGYYHNRVLYSAVKWEDSINAHQEAYNASGSLLSADDFGEPAQFDPRTVAHDLTIINLFNVNQTLFDAETEMHLAEQAHQLTDQAISSKDIGNPNSVVYQLLASSDFYTLSSKEQSYFLRLTEVFKTNDYGRLSQLLSTEMENFNNDTWGAEEGLFVQGFMSICQGSLEFWSSLPTLHPNEPTLDAELPWIQIDAAGYLYGWVKSWAVDEETRKRVRIKNGLVVAAEWSSLRYFLRSMFIPDHPFRPITRLNPNAVF